MTGALRAARSADRREDPRTVLAGGLIASCQPVEGGPTDRRDFVVAFALAALAGGARGLRIEGVANVAAVVARCAAPVIGLVKRDLRGSPVRITPFLRDARALAAAGARIVAFDATRRRRPVDVSTMIAAIHGAGALAMADVATVAEARAALAAGADMLGTTLSGYVGPGPVPEQPDLDLVRACAALGTVPVYAEGRFNAPGLAAGAMLAGAAAVVVGSAITRPEHIAGWFARAIAAAAPRTSLGLELGEGRCVAALLRAGSLLERIEMAAPASAPAAIGAAVAPWRGGFADCAIAATLRGTPSAARLASLADRFSARLGVPALALPVAQAAAWGEHCHGAARGRDLLFADLSHRIDFGLVLGGRLRCDVGGPGLDLADPRSRARAAALRPAHRLAAVLRMSGCVIAPGLVVVGGEAGLAPGFLARLRAALADAPPDGPRLRPVRAALGRDAALVGAAAFARTADAAWRRP
jgi:N-acetylmannosamine-6-phosphate 2-epimerase / N-acetylmannosamine kinase